MAFRKSFYASKFNAAPKLLEVFVRMKDRFEIFNFPSQQINGGRAAIEALSYEY